MKTATVETWQEDVLDNPLVLVNFYASWSSSYGPQLSVLEQLEADVALLSVVNVDANKELEASVWSGVSTTPTLVLYKNGEKVWALEGGKPRGVLLTEIAPYV